MKKRLLAIILAGVMTATSFAGCGNSSKPAETNETKTEETAEAETGDKEEAQDAETFSFTDSAGRVVELPKKIDRIACSGGLSQMVLLTVAPEKLVGLSMELKGDITKYVGEKYSSLPAFGQLYGSDDLNKEALAAADPQVIIDIGEKKKSVVEDMDGIQNSLGIPAIFIEATLATTGDAYRTLGDLLGTEKGKELGDYCDKIYKEVQDNMAKIPEDKRKSFLFLQGDKGVNVIAEKSFHAEVLNMFGKNVADIAEPTSKGTGDEVSQEQIALWNPEYIIFGPNSIYSEVKDEPFFSTLEAVKSGNYYEVPSSPYNWIGMPPSINRFLGMQWLGNLYYPETFDYKMYDRAKEYFKLFYNYDLSEDEYNSIVKTK